MLDWLDKLREKPKFVRDQVAFFAAATITGLIAVGWAATIPGHFANFDTDNGPEKEAVGAFANFFSDAKTNIAGALGSSFTNQASETASSTEANPPQNQQNDQTKGEVVIPNLETDNVNKLTAPKPRTAVISTTTKSTTSPNSF